MAVSHHRLSFLFVRRTFGAIPNWWSAVLETLRHIPLLCYLVSSQDGVSVHYPCSVTDDALWRHPDYQNQSVSRHDCHKHLSCLFLTDTSSLCYDPTRPISSSGLWFSRCKRRRTSSSGQGELTMARHWQVRLRILPPNEQRFVIVVFSFATR